MKSIHIGGLVLSSVWIVLTLTLLIIYSKQELDISKSDDSQSSDYSGGSLIAHHTLYVASLLFVVRAIVHREKHGWPPTNDKYALSILGSIGITYFVSMILGFILFLEDCASSLPCVNYRTPLYVLYLINFFIPLLAIAVLIIFFLGALVYAMCCSKETCYQGEIIEQKEQKEHHVQVTLETLQQVHQHNLETKCVICADEFAETKKKGIEILKCSHYFHTTCIKQWKATSRQCPVCKAEM